MSDSRGWQRPHEMELVRLLLPGTYRDGHVVGWQELASASSVPVVVDGYTAWADLVPDAGEAGVTVPWTPSGLVAQQVGDVLAEVIRGYTTCSGKWMPDALWDPARQVTCSSGETVRDDLVGMVAGWARVPFSGRAWAADVLLEAPARSDSLLLTAPRLVVERLAEAGLEVHPVTRTRPIPFHHPSVQLARR